MTIKEEDSYESLQRRIRDALFQRYNRSPESPDQPGPDYSLEFTYPDKILVKNYQDGFYYKIQYTINLDGEVEFGETIKQENQFNDILNSMKQGHNLILLNNTGEEGPTYRLLLQTSQNSLS